MGCFFRSLTFIGKVMPKTLTGVLSVCLVLLSGFEHAPAHAAVQDYAGIYSGTYTGADSGTWSAICDIYGTVIVFSWSYGSGPDGGEGTISATGHITVTTELEGTSISAYVRAGGTVDGTWSNPYAGVGGSLSGRKSQPHELAQFVGSYSGTFAGDDTGTWNAVIDADGIFDGTGWSNDDADSFDFGGFVNYAGEMFAVTDGDAIVHATINMAGVLQGTWYHYEGIGGTISGTRAPTINKPTVTTGSAASVSAGSATLNGTVNPNGAATSYHFEYGTSTAYGQQTTPKAAGSGTGAVAASAPISGLAPGTGYHFRLVATNSAGTTNGGDEEFTTLSAAPAAVTAGSRVGTPESAVLHGTVVPNGAETTYYFEYGETTGYGFATVAESAGAGSAPVSVSAAVSGLLADTTYHYRLVADNGEGQSTGADATFSTEFLYVEPLGVCGGKSPCYATVESAVEDAGSGATINIATGVYAESPVLDVPKKLTLSGGWNNQFTALTGYTTLSSLGLPPLAIENGTLVIERLILSKS